MHNLKNIDVDLPRNSLVVFTGLSGSGKSSLIVNTLYPAVARRINRARLEFKKRVEPLLNNSRTNDPSIFWKATRASDTSSPSPDNTEGGTPQ